MELPILSKLVAECGYNVKRNSCGYISLSWLKFEMQSSANCAACMHRFVFIIQTVRSSVVYITSTLFTYVERSYLYNRFNK